MVQAALLLALALSAAPPIRDPRPESAVFDTTHTLLGAQRAAIDEVARRARASGRGELLVVVVGSVAPDDPREFATRLFNRLGIGDAEREDGVLLFAALDDRAAELILGSGVDDDGHVAASESIMQDVMVPRFRAGEPGDAMVRGARAAAERILGVPLEPAATPDAAPAGDGAAPSTSDAMPAMDAGGSSSDVPWGKWGFGGSAVGALGYFVGRRTWWRRRPRKCPTCYTPMTLLGEVEDDAHLSAGEQAEERIRSVDYDVWHCNACSKALKLRWGALWSRYGRCPSCDNVTKSSSTTTLQHATEYSGGLVEVNEKCEFCEYRNTYTRTTPRIDRSTRSSYRSSSSGFRSSSSSGGFRSGGGSSGRGSSGRW